MELFDSPSFLITFAVVQTVLFLALIRLLDPYEHEPFAAVALMAAWGAIGATSLSLIGNELITDSLDPDLRIALGPAISAPIVEELAKGIALVGAFAVSWWAHKRYGTNRLIGVTDGIVYGAAIGLGFAFTEDLHFLVTSVDIEEGLSVFIERRGFFGTGMLKHAIFTATFGVGIGLATWKRGILARVGFPVLGLFGAVLLHSLNNGLLRLLLVRRYGLERVARATRRDALERLDPDLVSTIARFNNLIDYLVIVAFIGLIAWWIYHQRRVIIEQLPAEVDSGLIEQRDVELVPFYWRRVKWYWELVRIGELDRARIVRRLHIELANLAFMKWRSKDPTSEAEELRRARQRVANLKAAENIDVYAPGSFG